MTSAEVINFPTPEAQLDPMPREDKHPQSNEGVFEWLPTFDTEVKSIVPGKPEECTHGDIQPSAVTIDDGRRYNIVICKPYDQSSDTAVVAATALGVPLNHEHNRKTVRSMLFLGYPMVMIGPSIGHNAQNNPENNAHDMNRIVDDVLAPNQARVPTKKGALLDLNVREDQVFGTGGSRGAMLGLSLSVPEYARDRKAPYSDWTDPCAPRAPITRKEYLEATAYIGTVVKDIGYEAIKYALRGEPAYLKNFITSEPTQGLNVVKSFWKLSRGMAGKMALAGDPKAKMHFQFFEKSKWALIDDWEMILKDRIENGHVVLRRSEGGHGKIPDKSVRRQINARFEALRDARGKDGSVEKVDFEQVMNALPNASESAKKVGKTALKIAA